MSFKVVTYNVLNDPLEGERVPALLNLLENSDADFICLQEVEKWFEDILLRQPWMEKYRCSGRPDKVLHVIDPAVDITCDEIRNEFTPIVNQVVNVPESAKENPHGSLLILTRQPVAVESTTYYETPSTDMRLRTGEGGLLVVEATLNNRKVAVANTHLDSGMGIKDPQAAAKLRSLQLDTTFAILKHRYPDCEQILVGDTNFCDGDEAIRERDHVTRAQFDDVWKEIHPDQAGYTWDIDRSEFTKRCSTPSDKNSRLDRVLVHKSGTIRADSINIIGDQPVLSSSPNVLYPSDHFGLSATFNMAVVAST